MLTTTPKEMSSAVRDRSAALAYVPVIRTILSPYEDRGTNDGARFNISGPDLPIPSAMLTSFALRLHEFATNAAKYGALATPERSVDVERASTMTGSS